jgi:hypothetical protein
MYAMHGKLFFNLYMYLLMETTILFTYPTRGFFLAR